MPTSITPNGAKVSVAPVLRCPLNAEAVAAKEAAQRGQETHPGNVKEITPWGGQLPNERWDVGRRQTIAYLSFLQQMVLRCSGPISLSML